MLDTWDCAGENPPCETCSSRVSEGTWQSPYGCAPYVAHILSAGRVKTGCGKCGDMVCYSNVEYNGKYYNLARFVGWNSIKTHRHR